MSSKKVRQEIRKQGSLAARLAQGPNRARGTGEEGPSGERGGGGRGTLRQIDVSVSGHVPARAWEADLSAYAISRVSSSPG